MLKFSILLNSAITMVVMVLNFGMKIYLAKHFSQLNLVFYYTIFDMFTLITRVFIGYKDALTTIYYKHIHKIRVLQLFTVLFLYIIIFMSVIVIPLGTIYYISPKMGEFSFPSIWLSILFILMNFTSYFSYLFLVSKEYKILSSYDILKSLLVILMIIIFYIVLDLESSYKTLIYATILAYALLLVYLIKKLRDTLPKLTFKRLFSFSLPKFKDNTQKEFIYITLLASINYFIYGLLLYAPVFVMLYFKQIDNLANFQVVARSIYFAFIAIFSWPLGRFMFPELSSLIAQKKYKEIRILRKKFIKVLTLFSIVFIFLIWNISSPLIELLFPVEYNNSYKILNILIVALPVTMYTNFSTSILKALGSYSLALGITFIGLISFLVTLFILLYMEVRYPSIYSFVCSMIMIFLCSIYFENKYIDLRE